jgi:AcrR family transcriptional regulator
MVKAADDDSISGYGRRRLLDAAEELLDKKGIDGTSARAIAQAAGHRNVAAVNYHFGNREQLVREVLTRRAATLDAQRHALFDELEAKGPVSARDAIGVLLGPLIAQLDDPSGRRYVRLLNQAANHPAYLGEVDLRFTTSLTRGVIYLQPLVAHLPPERRPRRASIALGMALYAVAEQARLIDADPPRPVLDQETFTADLIDAALGALTAPQKPPTARTRRTKSSGG